MARGARTLAPSRRWERTQRVETLPRGGPPTGRTASGRRGPGWGGGRGGRPARAGGRSPFARGGGSCPRGGDSGSRWAGPGAAVQRNGPRLARLPVPVGGSGFPAPLCLSASLPAPRRGGSRRRPPPSRPSAPGSASRGASGCCAPRRPEEASRTLENHDSERPREPRLCRSHPSRSPSMPSAPSLPTSGQATARNPQARVEALQGLRRRGKGLCPGRVA